MTTAETGHCCDDVERNGRRAPWNCVQCEIKTQRQSVAILVGGVRKALSYISDENSPADEGEFAGGMANILWDALEGCGYPMPPEPDPWWNEVLARRV